ncbi:transcription factor BIM2-like isoform X2 [Ananas comosus]|uniref:Transcription factor BIM2-like isoform X2 n=1 Tax=Ananas comosus TaxID=4615 RepID=A0A6P5EIF5_ANACO|nr:transcription factor BIM2-like isoform X2 [Ananas comosus]
MELQGKKATHDFLSLYTKDSDPKPPPQGFYLKTHDFLQPLERAEEARKKKRGDESAAVGPAEHVLPGGIGTFSISHVSDPRARAAVKSERGTCAPAPGFGPESKPESVPFALWGACADHRGQWSSPFAAHVSGSASFGSVSSASRNKPGPERKQFMDAVSRSSKGFEDDEEEEEEEKFARREASSSHKELGVKIDGNGRGGGNDQRPNTPRSKHSATEQRRRSKINDRFQILRELIPHSDQKRDKASFLLEVIEYIRFLQERVQKYESSCPEWNEDNVKMMPWVKVYFRSFWKNSRNNNRSPENFISDSSQINKSGSAHPQQTLLGKINDNHIQIAHTVTSDAPNPTELNQMAGVSFKATENPPHCPDADNNTFQAQNQWLRSPLVADSAFSNEMLNQHEELAIDDGTINVSCHYSQELLTTLSQALQNSGLDLSQASISVQINLGKRAANKRSAAVSTSSPKDHVPAVNNQASEHARAGNTGQEFSEAPKRRRVDNS